MRIQETNRRTSSVLLHLILLTLGISACRGPRQEAAPASAITSPALQTSAPNEPEADFLVPTLSLSTQAASAPDSTASTALSAPSTSYPLPDASTPLTATLNLPLATGAPSEAQTGAPTGVAAEPSPTPPYQSVFEPAACAFPAPEGTNPECGYLVVPEDRSRPDSPAIRLHLAIFRSPAPNKAPDPVVYLAGGPGNSALDEAASLFTQGLDAVLERRDLILIDQRGTGYSQPRLDCGLTEAFERCRKRHMEAGVDLSAYTSADNAADLNDLRLVLGYPQLNLYAFSYGTRLALTLMRDHPETVRSAVLDSTFPPQVHLYNEMTPNAARALKVLFSQCASDPGCGTAFPDLENVFYSLVARLQDDPVVVRIGAGEELQGVKLDGGLLIDLVYSALYSRAEAERLPAMIYAFQQGDYDALEDRLRELTGPGGSQAMLLAVHCSEEIPFGTLEEAYQAAQGISPQFADYLLRKVQSRYALCQEWGLPPPDPRENEPVASNLPALVLAGEIDPVTPPDWGRLAAGSLPNSFFFEFPGSGHGLVRSTPCALGMALAFWENPAAAPDAACLGAIPSLQFPLNP